MTDTWYQQVPEDQRQELLDLNDALERGVFRLTEAILSNDKKTGGACMEDVAQRGTAASLWWLKTYDLGRLIDTMAREAPPDGTIGAAGFGYTAGFVRAAQTFAAHLAAYVGKGRGTLRDMGRHKGPAERALLDKSPDGFSADDLEAWREVLWADAFNADLLLQVMIEKQRRAEALRARNT